MSNEENTVETEEVVEIEKTVEIAETEKTVDVADSTKDKVGNIITLMLDLKQKNPKVFFGAIGGVVVLLLILMMSGGNDEQIVKGPTIKNLVVGQKYTLKSANSYDPAATVRLVGVPGALAAYDDTEEADRNAACQHIPQGTPVSVIELQDAYGTKNAFVKVQMEEGSCKGKDGWALAIDVQ